MLFKEARTPFQPMQIADVLIDPLTTEVCHQVFLIMGWALHLFKANSLAILGLFGIWFPLCYKALPSFASRSLGGGHILSLFASVASIGSFGRQFGSLGAHFQRISILDCFNLLHWLYLCLLLVLLYMFCANGSALVHLRL